MGSKREACRDAGNLAFRYFRSLPLPFRKARWRRRGKFINRIALLLSFSLFTWVGFTKAVIEGVLKRVLLYTLLTCRIEGAAYKTNHSFREIFSELTSKLSSVFLKQ